MNELTTRTNEVTLNQAKEWTKLWQEENPNHCKAFLIPSTDLVEVLKEMKILVTNSSGGFVLDEEKLPNSGVRTYMAIDTTEGTDKNNGYGEKLVIVGTAYNDKTKVHSDIIKNQQDPNSKDSGIYDFTHPCPTTCDPKTPLIKP